MVFQVFVRDLSGNSKCLKLESATVTGHQILELCYPSDYSNLFICTGTRALSRDSVLSASPDGFFPTCHVSCRLLGGKGGFGSLLRGAATRAGQKKTSNFDACRDMSGRRLRHVNAEKKLKEWKHEVKERKLEKVAQDYIKQLAKAKKKAEEEVVLGSDLREKSAETMDRVAQAVKAGMKVTRKRARGDALAGEGEEDRKGKQKLELELGAGLDVEDEEETDDEDNEDGDDEDEQEVDNDEDESEDEDDEIDEERGEGSGQSSDTPARSQEVVPGGDAGHHKDMSTEGVKDASHEKGVKVLPELIVASAENFTVKSASSSEGKRGSESPEPLSTSPSIERDSSAPGNSGSLPSARCEEALDWKTVTTASDLEALGLERLKDELVKQGLKCGGTLQERAARLFLLKDTPLHKLDKKHFAKPMVMKAKTKAAT